MESNIVKMEDAKWAKIRDAADELDALASQTVIKACDVGDMLREIRLTMDPECFVLQVGTELNRGKNWASKMIILSFRRDDVMGALASGAANDSIRSAHDAVRSLPSPKTETEEREKWPKGKRGPKPGSTNAGRPRKDSGKPSVTTATHTATSDTANSLEWDEVATLSGISTEALAAALEDYTHPQYMVAKRLATHREQLCSKLKPLSKPERKRVMDTVISVFAFEQEVFEAECNAAKSQYNKDLQSRLKDELDQQKKVSKSMKNLAKDRFDRGDFKFIRGVLHSDREVSAERKEKAFDLFLKLEPFFK